MIKNLIPEKKEERTENWSIKISFPFFIPFLGWFFFLCFAIFFFKLTEEKGSECCRRARMAPDQTVLVTCRTRLEPSFLREQFVAAVALIAQKEPVAAASLAHTGFRLRQPLNQLLQLAGLVELPDFLRPADVLPADENRRQGQLLLPDYSL